MTNKKLGRDGMDGTFTYRTLLVAGMHFMDNYNYDIERVKRCVIHYAAPDGKLYPFCTYNSGPTYREKIEKQFSIPFEKQLERFTFVNVQVERQRQREWKWQREWKRQRPWQWPEIIQTTSRSKSKARSQRSTRALRLLGQRPGPSHLPQKPQCSVSPPRTRWNPARRSHSPNRRVNTLAVEEGQSPNRKTHRLPRQMELRYVPGVLGPARSLKATLLPDKSGRY